MRAAGIALLCAVLLSPAPARAQGWTAGASVGGTDSRTLTRDAGGTSVILDLRREAPRWLSLSAGVPLDGSAVPWAALGAGGRLTAPALRGALRSLTFGVDAGAHGYGYRDASLEDTGVGITAEALPLAAFRLGAAVAEVHAGARSYTSAFGDTTRYRAVLDAGARLSFHPDPRLSLTGDARVVHSAEGSFPFTGVEAAYGVGRVVGWASVGRYLHTAIPDASWAVGASVEAVRGFRVEVAAQQEPSDPLYWNPARRFWSIGLTRAIGPAREERGAPLPAPGLPDVVAGRVVLRLPAAEAEGAPSVGGDFNGWTPVAMERVGDAWQVALAIEPGVYHYAFRRPDGSWYVPASFPNRVKDGFGGTNAVLVVPARAEP